MTYENEIIAWRKNREKDLREGIIIGDILWSPVPEKERKNLALNFFPISTDVKFEARITHHEEEKERTFTKRDGTDSDPFLETGYVEFEYEKKTIRLVFVYDKQTDGVYIGFRDLTCGNESYPNGRLLLIDNIEQQTTTLDFNKAFNFSCAYNETISCPITPQENWLEFAIEAGEKIYK